MGGGVAILHKERLKVLGFLIGKEMLQATKFN